MAATHSPLADDPLIALLLDELETKAHDSEFDAWYQEIPHSMRWPVNHCQASQAIYEPRADPSEVQFRHCAWQARRDQVRAAFVRIGRSASSVERFDNCGAWASLEIRRDGQMGRCRAFFCHDRMCDPCSGARRRVVERKLTKLCEGKAIAFTTVTLRQSDATYKEVLDRLYACWNKLRRRRVWASLNTSGVAVVQTTRGQHKDHWHVHLHILHTGKALQFKALRDAWQEITGDSFIVDSQQVSNVAERISYVARYATKGCNEDVYGNQDVLCDYIIGIRGRRMLAPFGEWYGLEDEDQDDDSGNWCNVGRVNLITAGASLGDAWCIAAMRLMRRVVHLKHGEIIIRPIEPAEFSDKVSECSPDG